MEQDRCSLVAFGDASEAFAGSMAGEADGPLRALRVKAVPKCLQARRNLIGVVEGVALSALLYARVEVQSGLLIQVLQMVAGQAIPAEVKIRSFVRGKVGDDYMAQCAIGSVMALPRTLTCLSGMDIEGGCSGQERQDGGLNFGAEGVAAHTLVYRHQDGGGRAEFR